MVSCRGILPQACLTYMQALGEASIFAREYRNHGMEQTGNTISLTGGSTIVFEKIFKEHFKGLHAYAYTMLKDEQAAEDVVQNMFLKLWEKKERIHIEKSIAAYLYRSVYNDCINQINHMKVRAAYEAYESYNARNNNSEHDPVSYTELEGKIAQALNELPEGCRTVFQMSRYEELKYHEIAAKLGISIKTVENQMGKALRLMREKLAEHLPAVLIFLLFNR